MSYLAMVAIGSFYLLHMAKTEAEEATKQLAH